MLRSLTSKKRGRSSATKQEKDMKRLFTVGALALVAVSAAFAADRPTAAYVPGLGEFMIANQIHHAKLWFAGSSENWDLAAYELGELKEGFDDAARLYPTFKDIPVGAMIQQNLGEPLADLAKIIDTRNAADFGRSFDRLTAACNTCHTGAAHAFIRISRPTQPPVTNQIYTPR
jgi:hypothetical protein